MASVTLTASADVACWTNQNYGAGLGDHLPVGTWSTAVYRSAIRFTAPSWLSWTAVTKATLNVYISDHQHVGVRNSTILVRRQTVANLWTKSAGTQDCENGFSSSNNTQNADLASTSTDQVTFSSGTTANAKKSITVTAAVQYYFNNKTSAIVFTFAGNSSSDYTELWSREKGSTYDATLVIEYETDSVPNAPTLNSPAAGEVVGPQQPTLSWTHNDPQSSPQVSAEVSLNGVNVYTVSGTDQSIVVPDVLNRGQTYEWLVRTADSLGYGAWSAARSFTVAGYVNPTITAKYLVWNWDWPRPRIMWTWSPPDGRTATQHRVMWDNGTSFYDTGWIAGNPGDHVASSWNTTENETLLNVKVWVQDSFGIVSETVIGNWTTRFGVSAHRKDLGSVPLTWGTPTLDVTLPGNGSAVIVQYGSSAGADDQPTAWYDSLGSVPKTQYLHIKYWFLHSTDLRMPTIHRHVVPTSNTVQTIDHWKLWHGATFGPPWSMDTGEYVYGTRSVTVQPDSRPGVWTPGLHSELMQLRAGRSYVMSGLMKSQGNSGANLTILSEAGNGLTGSEMIRETRDWFKADNLDTYRYKTPVYVSPTDQKVYAYLSISPNPDVSVTIDPDTNGGDMSMWSALNCDPPHLENGAGGIPSNGSNFYVGLMEASNATISSRANATSGMIPVVPGRKYRARFSAYGGGAYFGGGFWYINSGGGWIETQQVMVTGDWTTYDIAASVAPAGAAFACFAVANMGVPVWAAWDAVTIYEDYQTQAWFDAIKLEESTVATPWSPGAVGASAVDAGGVQIDGSKGAVFRYRGISGGAHNVVEGGYGGLKFGPMEIAASSAEGALDVSSSVAGTGAVIRVLGSGSTEAVEFYDNSNARLSMYTNDTQRLNVSAIIQPYAAAATGVQTSSHDENGNPYWGKIAQGRIEGQWRWGGITAICRTRYCVDIVSLHIMTDPAPPDQPYVDLNVKRLSKRSAGNKYIVGIDMDSGGCNWKLWGSAGQAYDAMTSFVQAVHVNGGWAWAVKPDSLEYSADPPGGWIYSAMYEQFVGSATP